MLRFPMGLKFITGAAYCGGGSPSPCSHRGQADVAEDGERAFDSPQWKTKLLSARKGPHLQLTGFKQATCTHPAQTLARSHTAVQHREFG